MNFIESNPLPLFEDMTFWARVKTTLSEGSDGQFDIGVIQFFFEYETVENMYNNIIDKAIIIESGKRLNQRGNMEAMLVNFFMLSTTIRLMNKNDELKCNPVRIIDFWWDGIGEWRG